MVVKGSGLSLCGQDRLSRLEMNWQPSHQALRIDTKEVDSVLQQYEVFRDELGHLKDVEVKIHVDAQAAPWFF